MTQTEKHSPGPWKVFYGAVKTCISDEWGLAPIASIPDPTQYPHGNANARLIAAAPDLLAACKSLLANRATTGDPRSEYHDIVAARDVAACQAAIAKAEEGE